MLNYDFSRLNHYCSILPKNAQFYTPWPFLSHLLGALRELQQQAFQFVGPRHGVGDGLEDEMWALWVYDMYTIYTVYNLYQCVILSFYIYTYKYIYIFIFKYIHTLDVCIYIYVFMWMWVVFWCYEFQGFHANLHQMNICE